MKPSISLVLGIPASSATTCINIWREKTIQMSSYGSQGCLMWMKNVACMISSGTVWSIRSWMWTIVWSDSEAGWWEMQSPNIWTHRRRRSLIRAETCTDWIWRVLRERKIWSSARGTWMWSPCIRQDLTMQWRLWERLWPLSRPVSWNGIPMKSWSFTTVMKQVWKQLSGPSRC